jgi:hypothetical protein
MSSTAALISSQDDTDEKFEKCLYSKIAENGK